MDIGCPMWFFVFVDPRTLVWIVSVWVVIFLWILEFQYESCDYSVYPYKLNPGIQYRSCIFGVDPRISVRMLVFQWEWLNGNPSIPVRILGFQWQYYGNLVRVMLKYCANIKRNNLENCLKIHWES